MTQTLPLDRRHFLAASAGLSLMPALAHAAPAVADVLEPAAIRRDLAIFAAAYEALHPGLDRYLGRTAFRQRVGALKPWADRPRGAGDLFLALGRLTAAVRCGHSYPNPVNQSKARVAQLFDHRDRIPFAFRWVDGQMIVTRALIPGLPIRAGDAVEAIDGIGARDLLARLLPFARADGANDGKRRALMEVDGTGRYGAFDVYRPLVGPSRSDGVVALRIGGRTVMVAAMTEAERKAAQPKQGDGEWPFAIGSDGIGILTMDNWAMYKSKWDWSAYLNRVVDRLIDERARGLVIDLRDNEGGNDCGNVLLERLVDRPLELPAFERFVRYRRAPEDLHPYLDTWDKSFLDWGEAARSSDRPGYFRLVRDEEDLPGAAIQPRGRRYAGPVAVIVSPTCSSATFQFANLVKGSGVARLVGRTTGGNRRGINGGAYFFLRLPGSGLEVDLPLIGYFPTTAQPDAGVEPDVAVPLRRADIASGFDRAMAQAKASLV